MKLEQLPGIMIHIYNYKRNTFSIIVSVAFHFGIKYYLGVILNGPALDNNLENAFHFHHFEDALCQTFNAKALLIIEI